MARIRTVKPEFWSDEKLAPLPAIDRLVFLGLIGMADDCGRVLDNVKVIDAFIFPNTSETSRDALATLSRIGRVRRGKSLNGQSVLQIVNWERHQKVDKPNLRSALPEIVDSQADTDIRDGFATDSRGIRDALAPRPTTNDLRPTTDEDDQGVVGRFPEEYRPDVQGILRAAHNPGALRAELAAMLDGMPGHHHATPECLGRAIRDLAMNGAPVTARSLAGFARRAALLPAGEPEDEWAAAARKITEREAQRAG